MENQKFSKIDIYLLITAFIWGINSGIMKIGIRYIPVNLYNSLRMIMGAVFCWIVLYFSKSYKRIEKKDFNKVILVSLFGFFPMIFCFALGLNYTTSGNALLIIALVPVSVVLINHILKIEKIIFQVAMGIVLSLSGVVFIVLGSGKEISVSTEQIMGISILLIGQFSCAVYTVFSKELIKKYSIYQIFAYMTTFTAILLGVVSFKEISIVKWSEIPFLLWLNIFYAGVLAASFGNFIWSWGVQKIGSTKTSLYNNLPPVFAVIFGYVFLNEYFGIMQMIGALVIFIGLYITRRKKLFITSKEKSINQ